MSLFLGVTSCHWFNPDDEVVYDRTVLAYIAAENSLSYGAFHEQDIDEMLQAAGDIPANSRLLIYLDDTSNPRILSIEQQSGRRPTSRVVHEYSEEQNSGDVETLRTVMEWVCDHYPSSSYGLIFWSHGDAWLPAKAVPQRSICIDNGRNNYSNSGSKMDIADVADVLDGFPCLEFILFDACFMQAVEVAYELRHVTRHVIASPAEIPNPGAPYERMVKPFFSVPFDGAEVVEQYYRMYNDSVISVFGYGSDRYGVSLSVIDCSRLDALADATAEMITKYVSRDEATDLKGIQRYYPLSSKSRPEFYDMNGYMRRLIKDEADYVRWKSVFDLAVPYARSTAWWYSNDAYTQRVDLDNYGGVSCYVPQDRSIYDGLNEKFRTTSWYVAAGWQEVGW
ncbi:MAG: hypothetical protein IKY84_06240 [Bacteroidaceae bacterium]|nr:hypothetical protein [Bacteroidaceae bacterium]